jgi:NAD(P)-dependent dehydrogenase (short-subunit alcohol dehydrogenase family)
MHHSLATRNSLPLRLTRTAANTGLRKGLFNFAQQTLPRLLESVPDAPHPPTLIVTGATASVRGSARFATFAASKFAARALAQSLSREFHPRGVHVAHTIIDGVIDIPRLNEWVVNEGKDDGKISPDSVSAFRQRVFLPRKLTVEDRRELLVSAHPAPLCFHARVGFEAACGEVLKGID